MLVFQRVDRYQPFDTEKHIFQTSMAHQAQQSQLESSRSRRISARVWMIRGAKGNNGNNTSNHGTFIPLDVQQQSSGETN